MELAAITSAISALLFTVTVTVLALAAALRRHADTRNDAYGVLRLLLRYRHQTNQEASQSTCTTQNDESST